MFPYLSGKFFKFCVDFGRTERVQFEDDDYYYYVKAVPKFGAERKKKASSASVAKSSGTRTVRTANGTKRTM